jgi:hypothetical protein
MVMNSKGSGTPCSRERLIRTAAFPARFSSMSGGITRHISDCVWQADIGLGSPHLQIEVRNCSWL